MRCELIFAAGPDFVAIEDRLLHSAALGPGADEEPRLAGPGEPTLRRIRLVLSGHVRRPVVFVNRLESGANLVARINISQTELVRPVLTEQLIGEAAVAVLEFRRRPGRDFLNEVFAVPEISNRPLASVGSDGAALC